MGSKEVGSKEVSVVGVEGVFRFWLFSFVYYFVFGVGFGVCLFLFCSKSMRVFGKRIWVWKGSDGGG